MCSTIWELLYGKRITGTTEITACEHFYQYLKYCLLLWGYDNRYKRDNCDNIYQYDLLWEISKQMNNYLSSFFSSGDKSLTNKQTYFISYNCSEPGKLKSIIVIILKELRKIYTKILISSLIIPCYKTCWRYHWKSTYS